MRFKRFKAVRKKILFVTIFALLCCVFGTLFLTNAASGAEIVDRIVAVVNDDVITLSELNGVVKPYAEKIQTFGYLPEKERMLLFKVRENMLDRLINEKIEDQEIKRSKIEISEDEVDKTIERIKEANHYTDENLRAALAKDGLTMQEYRKQIKDQILRTKLVNLKVKSKIVITKEDIEAYYEKHIEKYRGKKQYHLRNIIMKVPVFASSEEKLEIKSKMEDILEKLRAGQPFETLAMRHSESPGSSEGGDLGVFEFDSLSPEIQKAVEKMEPGDFTPVIETGPGYQIFFIQEILDAPVKPLEEVAPEIEKILYGESIDNKYQTWIDDLRKQSVIKIIQ